MGIETEVCRTISFVGTTAGAGCRHDLLLRVVRPSYPGHDGGAEDAAYALQESAMDHLRAWFERWVLPRECRAVHESVVAPDDEDGDHDGLLDGPGLRWVDLDEVRTYLLTDTAHGADLRDS